MPNVDGCSDCTLVHHDVYGLQPTMCSIQWPLGQFHLGSRIWSCLGCKWCCSLWVEPRVWQFHLLHGELNFLWGHSAVTFFMPIFPYSDICIYGTWEIWVLVFVFSLWTLKRLPVILNLPFSPSFWVWKALWSIAKNNIVSRVGASLLPDSLHRWCLMDLRFYHFHSSVPACHHGADGWHCMHFIAMVYVTRQTESKTKIRNQDMRSEVRQEFKRWMDRIKFPQRIKCGLFHTRTECFDVNFKHRQEISR